MSAIADLHIISYDIVFAKDGHVLLRYSAEGSHCGQSHNGIEPSGRKAKWTAAAIFEVKDGKVHSFTKEWDKLNMWKQLGWVCAILEQDCPCPEPVTGLRRFLGYPCLALFLFSFFLFESRKADHECLQMREDEYA